MQYLQHFCFPKIAAIQEKTLTCVKVAFRQKTVNILTNKIIFRCLGTHIRTCVYGRCAPALELVTVSVA